MQVYINGRFLTQRVTGVQRFAIETIKQLDLYEDYNFILLVPKDCTINYEFKNIRVEKIGALNGHLWEQLELARYVKGHPLINLCNTAPLFKKIKSLLFMMLQYIRHRKASHFYLETGIRQCFIL